jgi:indoleamine 2,3-dioxygenase
VRAFAGSPSEAGFILNHVTMVAYSGDLVKHALSVLNAAASNDREKFNNSLRILNRTYEFINNEMEMMWSRSEPADYMKFRTFIMGTKNQPMFPNGVIYEGVSEEPLSHRGESGANDSMIPLGDNLLQLTSHMPKNPLTEALRDFRTYRPTNHKDFLEYVQQRADEVGVRQYALKDDNSATLYLANVDQIRAFRHRHWNFTKSYIMKYTSHPFATGGTPIVTWLPNQLGTVLDQMLTVGGNINRDKLTDENRDSLDAIWKRAEAQKRVLEREVASFKQVFKDQDKV